jgi:serine/threonine-protein kinase
MRLGQTVLSIALQDASKLAAHETATLARDLGEALSALHAQGYTHSDLSPSNVLWLGERAVLTDFGAATPIGESQPSPKGTFSYMCPEQVRGEPLDHRSDLFSLATLLWQCLSGERIFWRQAQHLCFMAVVEADPPGLPGHSVAEALLRQALQKDPNDRPNDLVAWCAEFAASLEA